MLQEKEHATEEKANETVEEIWTIINDAAQYMFCSAHSTSMAYDSLYCAWLKVHYPYELYVTMLKLYDEKKNTDKISAIISEMKRYKNISLTPGRFGQDNRDWLVDKEHSQISQSLSSIRYMSKDAAEDLYELGKQTEAEMGVIVTPAVLKKEPKKEVAALKKELKKLTAEYNKDPDPMMSEEDIQNYWKRHEEIQKQGAELEARLKRLESAEESYETPQTEEHVKAPLDCFVNVLRAIQMNTRVKTNQLKVLIELNYFEKFGKTGKLLKLYNEFFNGENSISKAIKSFNQRLEILRNLEKELPDEDLPLQVRLQSELENVGLCISVDQNAASNLYFVKEVDVKYGVKTKMYSVKRGTTGSIRVAKAEYNKHPFSANSLFTLIKHEMRPRTTFRNGERIQLRDERECWATAYTVSRGA